MAKKGRGAPALEFMLGVRFVRIGSQRARAGFVASRQRFHGWSDEELAKRAGIDVHTLQHFTGIGPPSVLARGGRTKRPGFETVKGLWRAFGLDIVGWEKDS